MRKYRSFEEVYPDEKFDVDAAYRDFLNKNPALGYSGMHEDIFRAGWEAAEKKLMEVQGE